MPERSFWVIGPGRGEIRTAPADAGGADPSHLRVRTRFSGISRGTEALVFKGRVPSALARTMRCPFQEGDFPAPVKYGYSSVGVTDARRS